jgi:integrase
VLKVILKHARIELGLSANAAADIPSLDVSQHRPYSREEPNALTAPELQEFLACLRQKFPQHFAMAFAGFATGLRPSSLRPLQRAWATNATLVPRPVPHG